MERNCPHVKPGGSKCSAPSQRKENGGPWCWWHDPAKADVRRDAGRRGASSGGNSPAARKKAHKPDGPLHDTAARTIAAADDVEIDEGDEVLGAMRTVRRGQQAVYQRLLRHLLATPVDLVTPMQVRALNDTVRVIVEVGRFEIEADRGEDVKYTIRHLIDAMKAAGNNEWLLEVVRRYEEDDRVPWSRRDSILVLSDGAG